MTKMQINLGLNYPTYDQFSNFLGLKAGKSRTLGQKLERSHSLILKTEKGPYLEIPNYIKITIKLRK